MKRYLLLLALAAAACAQTSITTIGGGDTISSSRTVINNNFASLNTNKVEGSSNLTTANRMVAVSGAGAVKELSAVTYDSTRSILNVNFLHTVPSGSDPGSLSDGDIWTLTGGGFKARLAGLTANIIAGSTINYASSVLQVDGTVAGATNGAKYGFGAINPGSTDTFRFGWASSTYTTGGADLWLPNSAPFYSYPAATPFRIGAQSGAVTDYVSFDGGVLSALVARLRSIAGDYGSPADGDIWYNSSSAKFRCREGGSTVNCIGGGAGSVSVEVDGGAIGTESTVNFVNGTGMNCSGTNPSGQVDITCAVDTAVMQTKAAAQAGAELVCAPASASSSNYTCSMTPTLTAYAEGMVVEFIPDATCTTGAITLNIDTVGSANIKQSDGSTDPGSGGCTSGVQVPLRFDGTAFRLPPVGSTSSPILSKSIVIPDPTTSLTDLAQTAFGQAVTITRVACSTDTGTATIQLDERAEGTPNTAGTDVMTSTLVCDNDSQVTTSFTNAGIAQYAPLNLQITATASTPGVVRVHIFYQ